MGPFKDDYGANGKYTVSDKSMTPCGQTVKSSDMGKHTLNCDRCGGNKKKGS